MSDFDDNDDYDDNNDYCHSSNNNMNDNNDQFENSDAKLTVSKDKLRVYADKYYISQDLNTKTSTYSYYNKFSGQKLTSKEFNAIPYETRDEMYKKLRQIEYNEYADSLNKTELKGTGWKAINAPHPKGGNYIYYWNEKKKEKSTNKPILIHQERKFNSANTAVTMMNNYNDNDDMSF